MDYNSSSFRNGAIDRFKGKFGKGQTEKPVTVRPSSEQVARVKGRMESDINKMDKEQAGYEYATSGKNTNIQGIQKDYNEASSFDQPKYVGKNIAETRSVYQGAKKAHSYAKSNYEKAESKLPMETLSSKQGLGSKFRVKKSQTNGRG